MTDDPEGPMTGIQVQILLVRLDERTSRIENELTDRTRRLERTINEKTVEMVRRTEFEPVRAIVYGLIALILTAVVGSLIALVVTHDPTV